MIDGNVEYRSCLIQKKLKSCNGTILIDFAWYFKNRKNSRDFYSANWYDPYEFNGRKIFKMFTISHLI